MTDPVTTALLLLMMPALVFAAMMLWAWRNKERIYFLLDWSENRRQVRRNHFIQTLITQPDNSRVWGVDISGTWDGNVDFTVTRAKGASFAIIKSTEGTVNIKLWSENTARARAAGLIVGSYHWLHRNSSVSCAAQALAAWNRVKTAKPCLPLFVDFETTYYGGALASPTYYDLNLFVTEYTRLSGEKPILYSSPGYMAQSLSQLGYMDNTLRAKLLGIWIANYGVSAPSLPMGFTSYLFWQFSAEGDAATITPNDAGKKEVDLNYFYGTLSQLEALAGGAVIVPPPPSGEPMTLYGIVIVDKLNLRNGPGLNYTDVGDVWKDDKLEAVENAGGWWRVVNVNDISLPVTAWAFSNNGLYIRAYTPTPPPSSEPQAPSKVVVTMNGVSWEATVFTKVQ